MWRFYRRSSAIARLYGPPEGFYTFQQQQEQLSLMRKEFLVDHEQRRLDATLQALESMRPGLNPNAVHLMH